MARKKLLHYEMNSDINILRKDVLEAQNNDRKIKPKNIKKKYLDIF